MANLFRLRSLLAKPDLDPSEAKTAAEMIKEIEKGHLNLWGLVRAILKSNKCKENKIFFDRLKSELFLGN